jgi:hypothetical protein
VADVADETGEEPQAPVQAALKKFAVTLGAYAAGYLAAAAIDIWVARQARLRAYWLVRESVARTHLLLSDAAPDVPPEPTRDAKAGGDR